MSALLVRYKVKEIAGNANVAQGYVEELTSLVEQIIQKSVKRATQNGRKTIFARDL